MSFAPRPTLAKKSLKMLRGPAGFGAAAAAGLGESSGSLRVMATMAMEAAAVTGKAMSAGRKPKDATTAPVRMGPSMPMISSRVCSTDQKRSSLAGFCPTSAGGMLFIAVTLRPWSRPLSE